MNNINKKMSLLTLLFAGLITNSQIVTAQTKDTLLTLETCIKLSFTNNFKLKQAQFETVKSRYQYKETLSNGFPQVNGIASLDDYFNIPVTMVSGDIFGQPGTMLPIRLGTKYNINAGIQVGQMIYNASYFASLQIFRKSCHITDLNLEKSKEELAYHIARLYTIIQISNLRLALLDSNLIAFQKIYEYSKQHYVNGFITKIELDRVLVTISNLEAENENLVYERNQQLNMLKYLIGIDPNQPITLTEDLPAWRIQKVPNDTSFNNNLDKILIDENKKLAELNLKLSRSAYLPSLTGYAVLNYNVQREQFDLFENKDYWYKTSFVGVKLNVPIFEGGRKKNKIYQNKIELEQAVTAQEDIKDEISTNYLNALLKLNSSESIALKLDKNRILAENVFRATNDQYRQGLKSLTEVLNTQSEYNASRLNWLQVLLQIRLTELDILKITGSIQSLFFN